MWKHVQYYLTSESINQKQREKFINMWSFFNVWFYRPPAPQEFWSPRQPLGWREPVQDASLRQSEMFWPGQIILLLLWWFWWLTWEETHLSEGGGGGASGRQRGRRQDSLMFLSAQIQLQKKRNTKRWKSVSWREKLCEPVPKSRRSEQNLTDSRWDPVTTKMPTTQSHTGPEPVFLCGNVSLENKEKESTCWPSRRIAPTRGAGRRTHQNHGYFWAFITV